MNDFYVQMMGQERGPYQGQQLHELLRTGQINEHTQIRQGNGAWFSAREIPGLYSDKDWTTTLLLSIIPGLMGICGIDRIYIGQVGLGILKLVTLGGCGIWWIIDIVLLAQNKLYDVNGLPLKK